MLIEPLKVRNKMPTLGFTDEGYYSIFTRYPGLGNVTYRNISKEALAYLERSGVSVERAARRTGDAAYGRVEFDRYILDALLQRSLVRGSGGGVAPSDESPQTIYEPEPSHGAFNLKLVESSEGWQLVIEVPKLPRAWLSSPSLLRGLSVEVEGQKIAAARLQLGSSPVLISAEPTGEPYTVRLHGQWPPAWEASEWAANVSSLPAHKPVLFTSAEQGGERLPLGCSVQAGEAYFVLVGPMRDFMSRTWPPPIEIPISSLGQRKEWEVFALRLPHPVSGEVLSWLSAIEYSLRGQRWSFGILSPPPLWIAPSGEMTFAPGQTLVVQASPPTVISEFEPVEALLEGDHAAGPQSLGDTLASACWQLRVEKPGDYCLRSQTPHQAHSLHFTVAPAKDVPIWETLSVYPSPLRVGLTIGGKQQYFEAFTPDHDEKPVAPTVTLKSRDVSVLEWQIECLGSVSATWRYGGTRGNSDNVDAENFVTQFRNALSEALRTRMPLHLHLDGNAFGYLRIDFQCAIGLSKFADATISLPPVLLRRARWLASAIPAASARPNARQALLDGRIREALSVLPDEPSLRSLARLQRVPVILLPHLRALATQISKIESSRRILG